MVSLIHLSADGRQTHHPDNVRIYQLTGTHHGGGTRRSTTASSAASPLTTTTASITALLQAAFTISIAGRPTLGRRHPSVPAWATAAARQRGEATRRQRLRGQECPERLYPQRVDYGPTRAWSGHVPRADQGSYLDCCLAWTTMATVSVSACPTSRCPGHLRGWNPRHPSSGGTQMNLLLNGSTIPFATTAERQARGDRRLSIEERPIAPALRGTNHGALAPWRDRYVLGRISSNRRRIGSPRDEFMQLESPMRGWSSSSDLPGWTVDDDCKLHLERSSRHYWCTPERRPTEGIPTRRNDVRGWRVESPSSRYWCGIGGPRPAYG
jgi:hypothetical protein